MNHDFFLCPNKYFAMFGRNFFMQIWRFLTNLDNELNIKVDFRSYLAKFRYILSNLGTFLAKNRNFSQKIEILAKNKNLPNSIKISDKHWNLAKNRNFSQKSKLWSKIEILVKNRNCGQKIEILAKNWNCGQKIEIVAKNRNLIQHWNFC